jgi:hypothetical protein
MASGSKHRKHIREDEIEIADVRAQVAFSMFTDFGNFTIMKRIAERFEKLGGMTTELSKKIGM